MLSPQSTLELLQKVEVEDLYQNLILQLNKDFQLSNLNESFEVFNTPIQLREGLSKIILNLLKKKGMHLKVLNI